jgi:hypothetical protein
MDFRDVASGGFNYLLGNRILFKLKYSNLFVQEGTA